MADWQQFFVLAGIPAGVAARYSLAFKNNRVTKDMLPDLDKGTLSELGVTAIGDQLAILRRIKDSGSSFTGGPSLQASQMKVRITGPGSHRDAEYSTLASHHRKGRPPPDRDEIYHVKMPEGNTHRTKQIMRKAEHLRQNGLAVRGTTGVRQSGRSVSPIDKTSVAARNARNKPRDSILDRLGVQGLRSDVSTKNQRLGNRVITRTIAGADGNIYSQVVREKRQPIIVTTQGAGRIQKAPVMSRVSGGKMPRVTVQVTGRRQLVTSQPQRVAGRMQVVTSQPQRVATSSLIQVQKPSIRDRISVNGGGRRTLVQTVDQYDDMDEEEIYEEDTGDEMYSQDEMVDDTMEDFEQDEYVEYVDEPVPRSVFNRLSK